MSMLWVSLFPMGHSMQLAEEVLRSGPSPEEEGDGGSGGFEGMEALARAIELGEEMCVCVWMVGYYWLL